ncbi:MAG: tryptophan synthase subunit alpha [Chitinophagales bacterium]
MSQRIGQLFQKKQEQILNVYCTAGFPEKESLMDVLRALNEFGADLIEIGMPYSDPLADGPVIQASSTRALANGMTLSKLFEQIRDMRRPPADGGIGEIPVILMGYMNPVIQYGFERFCKDAAGSGVDGLILPDLPIHEFETIYGSVIRHNGLDFIFLVTPETSDERIKKLDQLSSGFLYAVSSSSTTGKDKNMTDQADYFRKLKEMKLKNPILVGFGIRDRQSFLQACEYARGGIIGTAYIQAIAENKDIREATKKFLSGIRG